MSAAAERTASAARICGSALSTTLSCAAVRRESPISPAATTATRRAQIAAKLATSFVPTERCRMRVIPGVIGANSLIFRAVAATDDHTTEDKLRQLQELRDEALHAGSEKAVQRRRDEGRLLARERAVRLCDPGTFV